MSESYRRIFLACVAASALIVPSYAISATKTVRIVSTFAFRPPEIAIAKGGTIKWINTDDGGAHTVSAYGGGWAKDVVLTDQGDTTQRLFKKPGLYKYRCEFHSTLNNGQCSGMCGQVVVR